MAIDIQAPSFVVLPLDKIVSKLPVRRISPSGLKRIQDSMQKVGFLDNYPIVVVPLGDGSYMLVDGNHRYESATREGITSVPCLVKYGLPEDEMYRMAIQSNSASTTSVPMTLVSYAELIWARGKEGKKQEAIAEMLGWSLSAVKNYSALSAIKEKSEEAWSAIADTFEKVTTSEDTSDNEAEGSVTKKVTNVTFTEGLLRNILPLTSEQQLELVNERVDDPKGFTPGKFKSRAQAYYTRNQMKEYALPILGKLGEPYTTQLADEIYSGAYDGDWSEKDKDGNLKVKETHPKLDGLIQSIRDEWEKKNSIHTVNGDFCVEVQKIGTESIDLVLTDPPYNIARDNEFELQGRSNISQDFGEWDKHTDEQFVNMFSAWGKEWARVLRPQGSGYVFTSDSYISDLRKALISAGLHVKATIIWHKKNPGTQVVKTNFKSSVEYILFFTKEHGAALPSPFLGPALSPAQEERP